MGALPRESRHMPALARLMLVVAALVLVGSPGTASPPDPVGSWPLRPTPEVLSGFEPPSSTWGPGHRGVDLGGRAGQPVRAALPGAVSFVGVIAGRGVVVVDHGDTRTTYEPVASDVARGTPVAAGEIIGTLTLPGSHCFPRACVHWGWIRGQTYLDPLRLVGRGPVRLLPLTGLLTTPTVPVPPARPLATPYAAWQPLLRLLHTWFES